VSWLIVIEDKRMKNRGIGDGDISIKNIAAKIV